MTLVDPVSRPTIVAPTPIPRALARIGRAITVIGSSATPPHDPDYERARQLARRLGDAGYAILTGGGPGIMEAANLGARDAGVTSVGMKVGREFEQIVNPYVDVLLRFDHVLSRKTVMEHRSIAIVAFPGGLGTLDELFGMLEGQLRHTAPSVPLVLVGSAFWRGLVDWLETEALAGRTYIHEIPRLHVVDRTDQVLELIAETA